MLVTCDGNDSLKRCLRAGATDHRRYESTYYIPRSQVDTFQNEVPSRRREKSKKNLGAEESACEKRWKNAKVVNRPDGKHHTFFDETGIFVTTCRHSFILTACDMVRSGEQ
jgi:hypothetical protein